MPSTPVDSPFDLIADINSPDRHAPVPSFLRHQQIKNVLSTAEVMEQQNQRLHRSFKMLNVSTPDSSQTDQSSDDVSPKIQRRRKNLLATEELLSKKHNLPKLSISVDHDHSMSHHWPSPSTESPLASKDGNKMSCLSGLGSTENKRVTKSASAVDLSLKISPSYTDKGGQSALPANPLQSELTRKDKTRLRLETSFEDKGKLGSDNFEMSSLTRALNNSGGNGSSTASSREVSPSRDGPIISNLKPP